MTDRKSRRRPIERRRVSRKTPGDGKLEITKVAAGKIKSLGSRFAVTVGAKSAEARLGSRPCTCRGDDAPHVHYFVESELLRSLVAGTEVDVVLDADGKRLVVETV